MPIPGTTKLKHIEENVKSCEVQLSEEEVEELRKIGRSVKGLRGDESYMKATFQANSL